jgi:hypothetical protein
MKASLGGRRMVAHGLWGCGRVACRVSSGCLGDRENVVERVSATSSCLTWSGLSVERCRVEIVAE